MQAQAADTRIVIEAISISFTYMQNVLFGRFGIANAVRVCQRERNQ
jgi:hypothetical protein